MKKPVKPAAKSKTMSVAAIVPSIAATHEPLRDGALMDPTGHHPESLAGNGSPVSVPRIQGSRPCIKRLSWVVRTIVIWEFHR